MKDSNIWHPYQYKSNSTLSTAPAAAFVRCMMSRLWEGGLSMSKCSELAEGGWVVLGMFILGVTVGLVEWRRVCRFGRESSE